MKILCIGTTPAAQRVMIFHKLTPDAVNRAATTLDGVAGKAINVAKILKLLGAHPIATGFLGGQRGEFLRAVTAEKQIESDFVTVKAATRQCITVIGQTQPAGIGGDRRARTQIRSRPEAGDAPIVRTRRATGNRDGGARAGAGV